jgi:hypothetical protein
MKVGEEYSVWVISIVIIISSLITDFWRTSLCS